MIDWASISLRDLAGYLSEELRKRGIDTILVGGACVTIYSENRYQSYDLDYITYVQRIVSGVRILSSSDNKISSFHTLM